MYCLKVEKIKNRNNSDSLVLEKIVDTSYTSFENFKDLYETKQMFDRKGNRWYKYKTKVYRVSNNGVEIRELSDESLYREILNVERELKKSYTIYSYLRQVLDLGNNKYWIGKSKAIDRSVLCVKMKNKKILEFELVRKTPKYEVRLVDGKRTDLLFTESSQNEIISILRKDFGIDLSKKLY